MKKLTLSIILTFFLLDFSNAQDWANLNRFQKINAELTTPKPGDHRIVFMGNSITEGWLSIRPEFFAGKPYVNRGISGQTTPQMLLRFRQDVIDLTPSVVVILAGINDIAGNTGPSTIDMIAGNIFSMAELAKTNNIIVVLSSVLPAFDFPWRQGLEPAEKVVKLNAIIKSYADKHKIVYVDYFTAMVNKSKGLKKELASDGIHPNETGYLIMEPLLENALAKALQKLKN
ncbi:MAG: acylhydrolase [Bacteroidetes bacterium 4572_117]|nr:MAG: acylhydrolase [Bacteroidetes bacterium 4572_117]